LIVTENELYVMSNSKMDVCSVQGVSTLTTEKISPANENGIETNWKFWSIL